MSPSNLPRGLFCVPIFWIEYSAHDGNHDDSRKFELRHSSVSVLKITMFYFWIGMFCLWCAIQSVSLLNLPEETQQMCEWSRHSHVFKHKSGGKSHHPAKRFFSYSDTTRPTRLVIHCEEYSFGLSVTCITHVYVTHIINVHINPKQQNGGWGRLRKFIISIWGHSPIGHLWNLVVTR